MAGRFTYWWPSSAWASWALLLWLLLAAVTGFFVGPVGAFINVAAWYLMVTAGRFVFIKMRYAQGAAISASPAAATYPVLVDSWAQPLSNPYAAEVFKTEREERRSRRRGFWRGASTTILWTWTIVTLLAIEEMARVYFIEGSGELHAGHTLIGIAVALWMGVTAMCRKIRRANREAGAVEAQGSKFPLLAAMLAICLTGAAATGLLQVSEMEEAGALAHERAVELLGGIGTVWLALMLMVGWTAWGRNQEARV